MAQDMRLVMTSEGRLFKEVFTSQEVTESLETIVLNKVKQNTVVITPPLDVPVKWATDVRFGFTAAPSGAATVLPWMAAFRLPELNFYTSWEQQGNKLVPTFQEGATDIDPASLGALHCPIPNNVELWYCVECLTTSKNAYLFVLIPQEEPGEYRWRLLPVPNQFNDGRLCQGTHDDLDGNKPFASANAALQAWMTSKWNTDLFSRMPGKPERFRALFQWDTDGKLVEQPLSVWRDNCNVAGNTSNPLVNMFLDIRIKEVQAEAAAETATDETRGSEQEQV